MRLALAMLLVAAFIALPAAQEAVQTSSAQMQVDDRTTPATPSVQSAQRDNGFFIVSRRWDDALVAGTYGWPYDDFGRDYNRFVPRYRDYALEYRNFAYDYRGFSPKYRDYERDYGVFAYDYQPVLMDAASGSPATTGSLTVDILPTSAEVYVDDQYIGMSYELGGGLTLRAGLHRLEIRAMDYETSVAHVVIEPGRQVSYQRALVSQAAEPAAQPSARQEEARPAMTVYFIPGCYLGNVPPVAARLPAGCDISAMKVISR